MSGAFRNAGVSRLFNKYVISDLLAEPIGTPASLMKSQTQSRLYLRFPNSLRKAKECEVSPSLFSSAFSSSSTSAAAKEVGIIGWYLGMVKCRPILTKSVTSALIYTAADLSSQVNGKIFQFCRVIVEI